MPAQPQVQASSVEAVQFSGVMRIKVALHARHSINHPTNNSLAISLNFLCQSVGSTVGNFSEHRASTPPIIGATCAFESKKSPLQMTGFDVTYYDKSSKKFFKNFDFLL